MVPTQNFESFVEQERNRLTALKEDAIARFQLSKRRSTASTRNERRSRLTFRQEGKRSRL